MKSIVVCVSVVLMTSYLQASCCKKSNVRELVEKPLYIRSTLPDKGSINIRSILPGVERELIFEDSIYGLATYRLARDEELMNTVPVKMFNALLCSNFVGYLRSTVTENFRKLLLVSYTSKRVEKCTFCEKGDLSEDEALLVLSGGLKILNVCSSYSITISRNPTEDEVSFKNKPMFPRDPILGQAIEEFIQDQNSCKALVASILNVTRSASVIKQIGNTWSVCRLSEEKIDQKIKKTFHPKD